MVWADNTRILAMFAVVFLHVAVDGVVGININSYQWWIANIYDALARWCVPVFVMLSGALLLSGNKVESMSVFYKKRMTKLLLPMLFWVLFFIIWDSLPEILRGNRPTLSSLGIKILSGKPHVHLWFLYMLIGLYLVTPFVRILVKNTPKKELLFLVIIIFFIAAVDSLYSFFYSKQDDLFINWFLSYLSYFILGYLLATSSWEPNKIYVLLIFTLSVLITAVGLFLLSQHNGLENGVYFYDYLSITVIPMSISIMLILKRITKPILINSEMTARFSGLVFGIYLLHPFIMDVLQYWNISALSFNTLFSVPVLSVFIFTMSAMIVWIIHIIPYLKRII